MAASGRDWIGSWLAVCLAFALAGSAAAGTVTWQVEGTIDLVESPFLRNPNYPELSASLEAELAALGIGVGAAWRAVLQFDSATPGVPAPYDPWYVSFADAVDGFELELASLGLAIRDPGSAHTTDATQPTTRLRSLGFSIPVSSEDADLQGIAVSIGFWTRGNDGWSDGELTDTPPDLSSLTVAELSFSGIARFPNPDPYSPLPWADLPLTVTGTISRLEAVPEPAAGACVAAALAGIAALRRWRRRSAGC